MSRVDQEMESASMEEEIPERIHDRMLDRYPRLREMYERAIRARKKGVMSWPEWCYVPGSAAHEVVRKQAGRVKGEVEEDVMMVAAVTAWRVSRTVIDLTEEPLQEVANRERSPSVEDLSMPVWCPFLKLSDGETGIPYGAFVFLEYDMNDEAPEFWGIVVDSEMNRTNLSTRLGKGSVIEGVRGTLRRAWETTRGLMGGVEMEMGLAEAMRDAVNPLLQIALHVSEEEWSPPAREEKSRVVRASEERSVHKLKG